MKKITRTKVLISKMALAGVFAASSVSAFADANLFIQANVLATCNFALPDYTLDFGTLDPAESADVQKSIDVSYWCTNGMITTLQADMGEYQHSGTRHMVGNLSGDQIPYALTLPAGDVPTLGPGTPIIATISGTVLNADYKNKTFGNYADAVTLTVTAAE